MTDPGCSPWNFPTAIPAGGVLAGLAAGSAVIFKPATITARTGALIAEIMWDAGVPKEVLKLVKVVDRAAGKLLISHPEVDRLILTGGYETAELFRSWRDDLPLFGETSGKNSIIVTPNADIDLAVRMLFTRHSVTQVEVLRWFDRYPGWLRGTVERSPPSAD